jgi:hypothetical protein
VERGLGFGAGRRSDGWEHRRAARGLWPGDEDDSNMRARHVSGRRDGPHTPSG